MSMTRMERLWLPFTPRIDLDSKSVWSLTAVDDPKGDDTMLLLGEEEAD